MQQQSSDFSSEESSSRTPASRAPGSRAEAPRGGSRGSIEEHKARSENSEETALTRYRIRPEEFLEATTEDDRASLRFHLGGAITHFLDRELAVYLESLGIFFTRTETRRRTKVLREKLLVHNDTFRTVSFEKCGELVQYHWEKFGQLVETRELVHQFYPNLPLTLRAKWTEPDMRRIIRGYLGFIRREIVTKGFSSELSQIAEFFSLHNRQGRTENDWYAGADIFILPRYEQTLFIEPCTVNSRPALENAWELLEAAFGKPRKIFKIDIVKQLADLGYDTRALHKEAELQMREIPVAVFVRDGDHPTLIYCTDGLRTLSKPVGEAEIAKPGNELVFQLALPNQENNQKRETEIPDWPLRPLTMGWILMQSAKSRTIRIGAGLSCDLPLIGNSDTELSNIFATSFSCARSEQLCNGRPFTYVNLIGVTGNEAAVAARYSPEFLLRLLEHKELDQCTKPGRSSIVARTGLLEDSSDPAKQTAVARSPVVGRPAENEQVFPAA